MSLQVRPHEIIPGPQLRAMRRSLQQVRDKGPEKFQLTLKTLAMWERLCIAVETLQAQLGSVRQTNTRLTEQIAGVPSSPFAPDFGFQQRLAGVLPKAGTMPLPPSQKHVVRLPGKNERKGKRKR